jgi:tetratricopeptide (TPR) repeat protein
MALAYKVENHYKYVSQRMGYKVSPPEITIYSYANSALAQKAFAKAKYFFELNVRNYPESFNAYNSFGDYYIVVNDESKAIDMFKKALSIMENQDTRKKLEKLQKTK